ncbi:biphenyl 2,3-dioxygenase [Pseudorhodoplanes sinuspersici]|nr:biphenyl 2,3-dioxygenase [Pseudorhodoplanes sinuspersici]RKE69546.1 putative cupredoxin-like copper-binding protein [Pseudorhodoplanes sinuspersici]
MRPGLMPLLCRIIVVMALPLTAFMSAANAAGDLSRQDPITVTVDLGSPGTHEFIPNKLRFETGKLYKLVLRNASDAPHYFTSHAFSQLIFTRKVQVTQERDGKMVTLAEIKGAIREIEVYPGHSAEWWFVPVATGRVTDLHCGVRAADGKTHAEHGMTGEIVIE